MAVGNIWDSEVDEFNHFIKEFQGESDRGCVLIAGSYLDEVLKDLILAFFADAKSSRQIVKRSLQTFSSRIEITHSLGLLSELEYKDLHVIREIRNKFAHRFQNISFDDSKVVELTNRLSGNILLQVTPVEQEKNGKETLVIRESLAEEKLAPKEVLINSVLSHLIFLMHRTKEATKEKRKTRKPTERTLEKIK